MMLQIFHGKNNKNETLHVWSTNIKHFFMVTISVNQVEEKLWHLNFENSKILTLLHT